MITSAKNDSWGWNIDKTKLWSFFLPQWELDFLNALYIYLIIYAHTVLPIQVVKFKCLLQWQNQ